MTRSGGEQGRLGGDIFVFIYPSQQSTILWPVSLCNNKWEWRGEGLLGAFWEVSQGWGCQTCHPGGPKHKYCPKDQGSIRRGSPVSAPTFASSVTNSYMPVFPKNLSDKGCKKSICGHEIRALPTTKDLALLGCVE